LEEQPVQVKLTNCGHHCCSECFETYLRTNLKDQRSYPLKCWEFECSEVIAYRDIANVLPQDELVFVDNFLVRSAYKFSNNVQAVYCPYSECGVVMVVDHTSPKQPNKQFPSKSACQSCNRDICVACLTPWHTNQTCAQYQTSFTSEDVKENTNRLIALAESTGWFSCPTCNMLIERTGGCNHLTHHRSKGCTIEGESATHFCSLCRMQLGGKFHKTEPNGQNHYPTPDGLFGKCRVVLEKEAGGAKKYRRAQQKQAREAARRDPLRAWQHSLFSGCTSDECRMGCLCPCLLAAKTETELRADDSELKYCCGYCCCFCVTAGWRRRRIRSMFGVPGCWPVDTCQACLCPCLTIIQEHREIHARANLPIAAVME